MEKVLYTATATSTGGRSGTVSTSDGLVRHELSTPGAGGGKTNPEQLFACGYSACFGSAVDFVARQKKIELSSIRITAHVSLGTTAAGGFALATKLVVRLGGVTTEVATDLAHAAHQVCPYSAATRGNMPVEIAIEG
jgi:Ohr subfamily peroxiredoxin